MTLMGFYDDGTAAQEAANDLACIDARRNAGLSDELPDDTDCEDGCLLYNKSCPFSKNKGTCTTPGTGGRTMTLPQPCEYLLIEGMDIHCLDSFSPSRCKCDHIVKPRCWGAYQFSPTSEFDVSNGNTTIRLGRELRCDITQVVQP